MWQVASNVSVELKKQREAREKQLLAHLEREGQINSSVLAAKSDDPNSAIGTNLVEAADDADEVAAPSLLSQATTDRVLAYKFPALGSEHGETDATTNSEPQPSTASDSEPLRSQQDVQEETTATPKAKEPEAPSTRRRSSRGAARKVLRCGKGMQLLCAPLKPDVLDSVGHSPTKAVAGR